MTSKVVPPSDVNVGKPDTHEVVPLTGPTDLRELTAERGNINSGILGKPHLLIRRLIQTGLLGSSTTHTVACFLLV